GGVSATKANRLTTMAGGQRVSRIVHNLDPAPVCDLTQYGHVAHPPREMNWNDEAGAVGNGSFHSFGVDAQCVRIAIDKHRGRTDIADHLGCGSEGQGRNYDLITLPHAQRVDAKMQGSSRAVDGKTMHPLPDCRGELVFKLPSLWACRQPA